MLELVENAHEQGLLIRTVVQALREEVPNLAQVAIRAHNQAPAGIDNGRLCEVIWQQRLVGCLDE